MTFTTKDSGDRREFSTGAKRDKASGKGRYDLLGPEMLKRDAELRERGAEKYGPNNWRKGIPLSSFIDSLLRHAFQLAAGDRSEDHAAAVRFNAEGYEWTRNEIIEGRLPVSLADHAGDSLSEMLTAIEAEEPMVMTQPTAGRQERRKETRRKKTIDPDTVGRPRNGTRNTIEGDDGRRGGDTHETQFP